MQLLDSITLYKKKYRVYESTDQNGSPIRLLRLGDGNTVESIYGKGPTGKYWDDIAAAVPKTAFSVLMIGVAGGTVARLLREQGFKGRIFGIEYDPIMLSMGKTWFLTELYFDALILADGTEYLKNCPIRFDAIILDAYDRGGKTSHNAEMYHYAENCLTPDGVIITNDFDYEEGNIVIVERPSAPTLIDDRGYLLNARDFTKIPAP